MTIKEMIPDLSMFSLEDQVAVVIGASRGIGRAIALAFAGAGADVVLASRNEANLQQVAEQVNCLGHRSLVVPTDISEADQIDQLVKVTRQAMGRVDVLVNNVGINPSRRNFEESLDEEWDLILNVNLFGTMRCLRAFGNLLREQRKGSVINITSNASVRGAPTLGAYGATKGALETLTKSIALEWVEYGVRVNAIAPGYVKTDLTRKVWTKPQLYQRILDRIPMGRFADPEEIAYAAVFLASDAARYITGIMLVIDGGWTAQ